VGPRFTALFFEERLSYMSAPHATDSWELITSKFTIGDKITGPITNVTNFGLFVRISGGISGLVHISDISWTDHINHPADLFSKGQEVDAVILKIDPASKRISLGIKQLKSNPWENLETEYPPGKVVEGVVSKITNFGVFIKLSSGVEGLAHISELSNRTIDNIEQFIELNSTHSFKVIRSSKHDRKLSLSLRAVTEPEETAAAPKREFQSAPPRNNKPRTGEPYRSNSNPLPLKKGF
jgi:small subunit ribosomal protein S1